MTDSRGAEEGLDHVHETARDGVDVKTLRVTGGGVLAHVRALLRRYSLPACEEFGCTFLGIGCGDGLRAPYLTSDDPGLGATVGLRGGEALPGAAVVIMLGQPAP